MDLNKEWDETCKVLLRQEIGPMESYANYLQRFVEPINVGKSEVSGKEIALSDIFPPNSKFISGNELSGYALLTGKQTLDINQIKDMDSLVESVKGRVYYAGNVHLGNSPNIHFSNRVIDSSFVYKSDNVCYSRRVAYCHFVRYSDYIFGSGCISKTNFGIKNFETYEDSRLMETVRTYNSSDCYYTANLENCQNCLFSFNFRNRRNCIGNLELPPDKFLELKEKLVGEIRETLVKKKSVISIMELIGGVVS